YGREGTRRRESPAVHTEETRDPWRGRGDAEGRLDRDGLLRRHQLRRRLQVPPAPGRDRCRRRHGRDQPRGPAAPHASRPARPRQGTRRVRHAGRPATTNERRLTKLACTSWPTTPGSSSLRPTLTSATTASTRTCPG